MADDIEKKEAYGDCYGCGHHREVCRLCRVSGQQLFEPVKDCPSRNYPWAGFHPDYINEKK